MYCYKKLLAGATLLASMAFSPFVPQAEAAPVRTAGDEIAGVSVRFGGGYYNRGNRYYRHRYYRPYRYYRYPRYYRYRYNYPRYRYHYNNPYYYYYGRPGVYFRWGDHDDD